MPGHFGFCDALTLFVTSMAIVACSANDSVDGGSDAAAPDAREDRPTPPDGGTGNDAGDPDVCGPAPPGDMGGVCWSGGRCARGSCLAEVLFRSGSALQLAVPAPGDPAQCLTAEEFAPDDPARPVFPSEVLFRFAPGGLCSTRCAPGGADVCGACATCAVGVGPTGILGELGMTASTFDLTSPSISCPSQCGICRRDCTFDPATHGGCPSGYSCNARENVCLEACVSDTECRLSWCLSRRSGIALLADADATCNAATGRCEWPEPEGAGHNTLCESDLDCEPDVGACLWGHCFNFQCNLRTPGGGLLYPCEEGAVCTAAGGNQSAICVTPCDTADDCAPGLACTELFADGSRGCGIQCQGDGECAADRRCRPFSPVAGTCEPHCDPEGGDTSCGSNEACQRFEAREYGFCEAVNGFCEDDSDCAASHACEVLGADLLGRCVPGCLRDDECPEDARCRIQAGSSHGVCRTPGGACSGALGDAQCVRGQRCSASSDELGTCQGELASPDAGTPDGGEGTPAGADAGA